MSASPAPNDEASPVIRIAEPTQEIARLLRLLQAALMTHPFAVRGAVDALVAEGRAFAETEAGRAWRRRLEGSSVLREARTLWEGLMLPFSDGALAGPSSPPVRALVDDFFAAAMNGGAEAAMARAFADLEVNVMPDGAGDFGPRDEAERPPRPKPPEATGG